MNYLRCLYREGDKVTHGTCVELTVQIPCHSVTSNLKSFHGEVCFLDYNYFLVVNAIPTQ